jgi:leader peptidase (prepilin peptidase) / N-methyltransferase
MPGSLVLTVPAFFFGLVIGSFLNVLVYRLPRGKSVVFDRSRCPSCGKTIAWYDNIPILSYVLLRARCRHCRAPISARYPVVELLSGAVAGTAVWFLGASPEAVRAFVFFSALLVITLVDWSHRIIPDALSIGGMVFGCITAAFCPGITFMDALLGAALGGGLLLAVALGYRAVRKVEGMGGGDVKLMAMIGAFLGWRMVFPVLILASFAGAVYGIYLMRRGATAQTAVAFGSFLAPSAALVYVFGAGLWDVYFRFVVGRP